MYYNIIITYIYKQPSSEGNCPDCKNFMVDLQTDIKNNGNITVSLKYYYENIKQYDKLEAVFVI